MLSISAIYAQNVSFKISDEILSEMKTITLKGDSADFRFKIVYPKKFDKFKTYSAVLALSGGNSDENSVNYSYSAMFRSSYFDSTFIIMPMLGEPLNKLSAEQMTEIMDLLIDELALSTEGWLLIGTSNGGVATFRFAYLRPELFSGIITMPGALSFDDVHPKWKSYRILLACGENDTESWKNAQIRDFKLLNETIEEVFTYTTSGEGHILSPAYNQDLIYDLYFNRKIR